METFWGKIIYIILFLAFCGVMEWRTRVLNARRNKAVDDMDATSQQIRNALRK